jgi:hypothetical protein
MTQFTRVVDGTTELRAALFNDLQEAIEQQSFNVMRYGAVGDGVTDDYQAVQDTLDAGAGHTIVFPPGEYLNDSNTSWILTKFTRLQGLGSSTPSDDVDGGVRLVAGIGTTVDLLVGETVDHASDYWAHGSQISNIGFFAASGQVSGSGIRWCPGENSEIANCSFVNFPEAGIRIQGTMAPGVFNKIAVFGNQYGIWLDGDETTARMTVSGPLTIFGLSGDDNKHMINIDNGTQTNPNDSGGFLNVHVFGIKAETSATGRYTTSAHNPLIRVWNPNACMVEVDGGFITNYGNADATTNIVQFYQNGGANARTGVATLRNIIIRGYTNIIQDDILSETYAWVGDSDDFNTWRRLGEVSHRHLHAVRSETADQAHGFTLRGTSPALYMEDTSSSLVPAVMSGSGDPENTITGAVGSLWLRNDGGANTTLYIKQSGTGNTGWAAVTP